jgi:excisionase family DNA binding protein
MRPPATGELSPGDGLPEFMLVKECATQLRVSPPVIYGLVRSGHVEAVRLGRELRIYTRFWLAYLQAARPGLRPQREPERDHPHRRAALPQSHSPHAGQARERRRSYSVLPDERAAWRPGPQMSVRVQRIVAAGSGILQSVSYPALSAKSSTRLVIATRASASLAVETLRFTGRCR